MRVLDELIHYIYLILFRTSVLFVSITFIILIIISLAWLIFYYVQRFRYSHARERFTVSTNCLRVIKVSNHKQYWLTLSQKKTFCCHNWSVIIDLSQLRINWQTQVLMVTRIEQWQCYNYFFRKDWTVQLKKPSARSQQGWLNQATR